MLSNKRVLVFGGESEISFSICKELTAQGARVVFVINENNALLQNKDNNEFSPIYFDYHRPENITLLFTENLNSLSPFDGLVFAGGIGGVRPIKLNHTEFVINMFAANVFSFMEIVRNASIKGFLNNGSSVVAISSVSSVKGLKSKAAYSASKAALEGAVRAFAAELAPRKIKVNAIQKGWVSSDMSAGFIQDSMLLSENVDFKKQLLGVIEPREISDMVAFLLSDKVKSITGTSIVLDGGYTL
jgi:NAD(P)-dependent dehydrogenase (short-subunit alcohol dehydrogenase family)